MMELNEEVDALEDAESIRSMLKKVEDRIDELCKAFKEAFETGNLNEAKQDVLKMGFFYRIKKTLNKKLDEVS